MCCQKILHELTQPNWCNWSFFSDLLFLHIIQEIICSLHSIWPKKQNKKCWFRIHFCEFTNIFKQKKCMHPSLSFWRISCYIFCTQLYHHKSLMSLQDWSLRIQRIETADSGAYKCQANSHPPQFITTYLSIHGKFMTANPKFLTANWNRRLSFWPRINDKFV